MKTIADRVTVLRDGRVVARRRAAEIDAEAMANLMVGREMSRMFPDAGRARRRRRPS